MATPCASHRPDIGIRVLVHGGDYAASGRDADQIFFLTSMNKSYACKVQARGLGKEGERQVKHLDRSVSIHIDKGERMISYEADPPPPPPPRQEAFLVSEFGLESPSGGRVPR